MQGRWKRMQRQSAGGMLCCITVQGCSYINDGGSLPKQMPRGVAAERSIGIRNALVKHNGGARPLCFQFE